ncbi:MAG: hypothetical protein ACMZ7B_06170 [Balneola sp.]
MKEKVVPTILFIILLSGCSIFDNEQREGDFHAIIGGKEYNANTVLSSRLDPFTIGGISDNPLADKQGRDWFFIDIPKFEGEGEYLILKARYYNTVSDMIVTKAKWVENSGSLTITTYNKDKRVLEGEFKFKMTAGTFADFEVGDTLNIRGTFNTVYPEGIDLTIE